MPFNRNARINIKRKGSPSDRTPFLVFLQNNELEDKLCTHLDHTPAEVSGAVVVEERMTNGDEVLRCVAGLSAHARKGMCALIKQVKDLCSDLHV